MTAGYVHFKDSSGEKHTLKTDDIFYFVDDPDLAKAFIQSETGLEAVGAIMGEVVANNSDSSV